MIKIDELKISKNFKEYDIADKKQTEAIKQHCQEHGQIYNPIFVWQETKEVLLGRSLVEIAKDYPELKYVIIDIPLASQQEAKVWIVEYLLPQPCFILWQKLTWSIDFGDYWELKERAKKAKGTRTDLRSDSEERLPPTEVNKIIARKVGCGATLVANFKAIYFSGKKQLIEKCEKGEMSISTAYEVLKGKKKEKGKSGKPPKSKTPTETMVTEDCDIFEECANNIDVGNKNTSKVNRTPPDPNPIIDKIQANEVPEGAFWVVLYRDRGALQVVKKSPTTDKGKIHIKLNAFNCKALESKDGVLIFEADHINGSEEKRNRKDETEFDRVAG